MHGCVHQFSAYQNRWGGSRVLCGCHLSFILPSKIRIPVIVLMSNPNPIVNAAGIAEKDSVLSQCGQDLVSFVFGLEVS